MSDLIQSDFGINETETEREGGLFLGVDVGGTNMKLGLVHPAEGVIARSATSTRQFRTPAGAFQVACDFAHRELNRIGLSADELNGVGVAVPGILDRSTGILKTVSNLPDWEGQPLHEAAENVFSVPTCLINDANAAAYGEYRFQPSRGTGLVMLTLGTGIGSGVIVEGEPLHGDGGCAGEVGHVVIDPTPEARLCCCGKRGHLEAYAGANGILTTAREKLKDTIDSELAWQARSGLMTPKTIAECAEKGDSIAQEVIAETAGYLGIAIAFLGQILNPSTILLGGAMNFGGSESETGRAFLQLVQMAAEKHALEEVLAQMSIDFAALGNDAGVLGAALLSARQSTRPTCSSTNNV